MQQKPRLDEFSLDLWRTTKSNPHRNKAFSPNLSCRCPRLASSPAQFPSYRPISPSAFTVDEVMSGLWGKRLCSRQFSPSTLRAPQAYEAGTSKPRRRRPCADLPFIGGQMSGLIVPLSSKAQLSPKYLIFHSGKFKTSYRRRMNSPFPNTR
jgi:hypothetical protein